jgi:tRNA-modifying protein YgfZ
MSDTKIALLNDRGVVRVTGEDATAFLDNLVTQDLHGMTVGDARFAALLTPQGKILFDFFVVRTVDGYLLDVARDKAAELVKRLTLYKLRAKVAVEDLQGLSRVYAHWTEVRDQPEFVVFRDPRHPLLGHRTICVSPNLQPSETPMHPTDEDFDTYHANRVSLGIPEGGKDYAFGDAFPHEANMDRLNGVSFTKGCFVGQEVVARMQHKTVVRKRIVLVDSQYALKTGAEVTAGNAAIGTICSVGGLQSLAMLRLDRAIEALDKGEKIKSEATPLTPDRELLQLYRAESVAKAEQKAARI